jgi:hypothetical protein
LQVFPAAADADVAPTSLHTISTKEKASAAAEAFSQTNQ